MARINIEDELYKDIRFQKLFMSLGSLDMAIGCLVRAWTVAQKWYIQGNKMIPEEEWEKQDLSNEILKCGLATKQDGFIKMRGADDQFSWLTQKIEAGRKGGIASRRVKKNTEEESIQRNGARTMLHRAVRDGKIVKPDHCEDCGVSSKDATIEGHHSDYSKPLDVNWLCKQCHTEIHRLLRQDIGEQPVSNANERYPEANPQSLTLPLSPSPILSLSPAPEEFPKPENAATSPVVEIAKRKKSTAPVDSETKLANKATWEAYRDAYLIRYQVEPIRNAKANSNIKSFVERVGGTDAPLIAKFYLSHNSSRYTSSAHSLGNMLYDAEKLRMEWLSGKQITSGETRSLENKQQVVNAFSKHFKGGAK